MEPRFPIPEKKEDNNTLVVAAACTKPHFLRWGYEGLVGVSAAPLSIGMGDWGETEDP